jgi:hypothetical protein
LLRHSEREAKYLKHIKKDKKVACMVCHKEYSHSRDLKNHYIKKHKAAEL